MRRFQKLLSFTTKDKIALMQYAMLLPTISAMIRLFGLRKSQMLLLTLVEIKNQSNNSAYQEDEIVVKLSKMIDIVAHCGFIRANCLVRAVSVWWLLQRRKIDVNIRIGITKESQVFSAHAWVEHCGMKIGDNTSKQYSPFEISFSPSKR